LEIDLRVKEADLNLIGGMEDNIYAQPAYGKSSEESRQAMYLLARKEAIITDAVYTGKAFNAMIQNIIKPEFKNKKVLFLHTGGAPSLFASPFLEDIQDELWHENVIQK
jgi:1-aminocyclopropane-1-carboxylate deaminase/D-cysteine desulfhydrase-like pyridoxal-dependent ACC family enzyme